MNHFRTLLTLAFGLCLGMLQTGCGSSPSGNEGGNGNGTYMTAQMNGEPWQAVEAAFLVKPAGDTASPGSSLVGIGENLVTLNFGVGTDRVDSVALETIFGKNIGEFTRDGNTFFTLSGYVKITRVTGSQVEGTFACEMIATDDSADPKKALHVTDGKFLAKVSLLPK